MLGRTSLCNAMFLKSSTVQHISLQCSIYSNTAPYIHPYIAACILHCSIYPYIAACIPTLQHIFLHCSIYHYIAACIPTLQSMFLNPGVYIFLCKWVYANTAGHDVLLHRRPCPYIVGHIGPIPWGDEIRENRSPICWHWSLGLGTM